MKMGEFDAKKLYVCVDVCTCDLHILI